MEKYVFVFWSSFIIFLVGVSAVLYLYQLSADGFRKNRRWIEQLPSLLSTLGVIGTFVGISIGLFSFEATDLDNSIPDLLEGLTTAFVTSLVGMVCSLVLSRIVSHKFDKLDGDSKSDLQQIIDSIEHLQAQEADFLSAIQGLLKEKNRSIEAIGSISTENIEQSLLEVRDNIESLEATISDVNMSIKNIEKQNADMTNEVLASSVVITKVANDMTEIIDNLKEE